MVQYEIFALSAGRRVLSLPIDKDARSAALERHVIGDNAPGNRGCGVRRDRDSRAISRTDNTLVESIADGETVELAEAACRIRCDHLAGVVEVRVDVVDLTAQNRRVRQRVGIRNRSFCHYANESSIYLNVATELEAG